jgi:hypothetical protein
LIRFLGNLDLGQSLIKGGSALIFFRFKLSLSLLLIVSRHLGAQVLLGHDGDTPSLWQGGAGVYPQPRFPVEGISPWEVGTVIRSTRGKGTISQVM